jgi:protocatechuate 3,4-dioxygenase beta subunit
MSNHLKLAAGAVALVLMAAGLTWLALAGPLSHAAPAAPTIEASGPSPQAVSTERAPDAVGAPPRTELAAPPAGGPALATGAEDAPFVLVGNVLDTDARAVPDVAVQLTGFGSDTPSEPPSPPTDAEGRFELVLPAVQGGMLDVADDAWATVYRVVLWGNRDVGELTLVVAPAAPVAGRVVDGRGEPLGNAEVAIHAPIPDRAAFPRSLERNLPGAWAATTDAEGRFAFRRPPRDARIVTNCDGYEPDERVLAADREQLEIRLRVLTRALLVGQVVRDDGTAAADAAVWCGARGVHADTDGRFAFDLAAIGEDPARHTHRWVVAAVTGFVPARVRCEGVDWRDPLAWPRPLVLRLGRPALSIQGRVLEADGTPVANPTVTLVDAEPLGDPHPDLPVNPMSTVEFLARVQARLAPDGSGGEFWESGIASGEAGAFELGGLQDRGYRLRVEHPPSLRAFVTEAVLAGSRDVELRFPPAASWGEIAGVVHDRRGQPVAAAGVWCERSADGTVAATARIETAADGTFRIPAGITREIDRLLVQAPTIAHATVFSLRDAARVGELRLVVPVRASVQVEPTAASRGATAVEFRRADGTPTVPTRTHGNMAWGEQRIGLVDGRSEVVTVPDDAAFAVLLVGDEELGRHAIELLPDGINRLRL